MKRVRSTTLSFQEGNSDKVYEAELIQLSNSEYLVNFRYGKRGATLREGTKTPTPVAYDAAHKLYKSLLVSKMNKGYELNSGFDPFSDEPPPAATPAAQPLPVNQDEQILERLNRWAQNPAPISSRSAAGLPYIDRHSLSRDIQAAGLRKIKAAAGLLPGFIAPKEEVLNYTIAWAMGQIGDVDNLKHLDRLESLLPDSHRYLIPEVRLALTERSQWPELINKLKQSELQARDYQALSAKLADYTRYEALVTYSLNDENKSLYQQALSWRGLQDQLLPLIDAVDLNMDWEKFEASLPEPLKQAIQGDHMAYAELRQALESIRLHRQHELKQQAMPGYAADMSLYQHGLSQIDLERIFPMPYYRDRAREGQLNWIWGREKEDLLRALRQTRLFDNFDVFMRRMESYHEFNAIASKPMTAQALAAAQAVLGSYGFLIEVQKVLNTVSLQQMSQWNFYQQHFSPKLNSFIQGNLGHAVRSLFSHRQDQLKQQQLAERDQVRLRFETGILDLYRVSLIEPQARDLLAVLLAGLPINHHYYPLLRKLYKIAEFRKDFKLLAHLQHKIEVSTHVSPSSYYKDKQKPFTRRGRDYFRRRMVRTLKQLAEFEPTYYSQLAVELLLPVRDDEPTFAPRRSEVNRYVRGGSSGWQTRRLVTEYPAFASHLALNYILRANSRCFILKKGGQAWIAAAGNQAETERPEAHPELWDAAPAELLRLLKGAQAQLVNDFALNTLRRQRDYCRNLANPDLFSLLTRPFENTALFAQSLLLERIDEPGVRAALMTSPYASVRVRALESLSAAVLLQDLDLAAMMAVLPFADVRNYLREHLDWLQEHRQRLAEQIVTSLLILGPIGTEGAREFLLQAPLRGLVARQGIEVLVRHRLPEFQLLGAELLEASTLSYVEIQDLLPLLEHSADANVRAGALRLLGKLSEDEQMAQSDTLIRALTDPEAPLRAVARDLLSGLKNPEFQQRLFARLVDTLFRAQAEGVGEDVLAVVSSLAAIYTKLNPELIWRLLNARSKLAQQAASLIVPVFKSEVYSLRQLVRLSKHASVAVRQWALTSLAQDTRTLDEFETALEILDNPWADIRAAAIDYLRTLPSEVWTLERTIAVVDQTYDDVEQFGRELIGEHFQAGQGETYLLRLSQHPSRKVQLFVSGFLEAYAGSKPELILALAPYFKTVLTQINQGRVLKDRVMKLLFAAAERDNSVATMVSELVTAQSLTTVINDKASYLSALYQQLQQHPELPNPLQVIGPRKAKI